MSSGRTWIICRAIRFSAGSIQNLVPQTPLRVKVPADPLKKLISGSVRRPKPSPQPVPQALLMPVSPAKWQGGRRHSANRLRGQNADAVELTTIEQNLTEVQTMGRRGRQSTAGGEQSGPHRDIPYCRSPAGRWIDEAGTLGFAARRNPCLDHTKRREQPVLQKTVEGLARATSTTRAETSIAWLYSQTSPG